EPLYQQALAIERQTLGPQHVDVATTLNNLAALARAMGRYTEAETYYQQALSIWQTTLGPAHPPMKQRVRGASSNGALRRKGRTLPDPQKQSRPSCCTQIISYTG